MDAETKKLKRELTLLPLIGLFIGNGLGGIRVSFAMAIGAVLYFPIRNWIKPGIADVDPFVAGEGMD